MARSCRLVGSGAGTPMARASKVDHLGVGRNASSLAHDDETNAIHYGADDNASGVSGVIEIAQFLSHQKANGLELKRDVIFATWSGEEISLLGSSHFTNTYPGKKTSEELYPEVSAYLNMDKIGRLDKEHMDGALNAIKDMVEAFGISQISND